MIRRLRWLVSVIRIVAAAATLMTRRVDQSVDFTVAALDVGA